MTSLGKTYEKHTKFVRSFVNRAPEEEEEVLPAMMTTGHSHMERPTGRCHLSTVSSHLQKTTKTASLSTFVSWLSLVNYCYSVAAGY